MASLHESDLRRRLVEREYDDVQAELKRMEKGEGQAEAVKEDGGDARDSGASSSP